MNDLTAKVLASLIKHAEEKYNGGFCMVYLDNASGSLGLSDKVFRAHLAQLSKLGLYRVVDGWAWGEVKVD